MTEIKKLRLLVVADYFFPHWTGIARAGYNLCRSLAKEFDITVLTVQHKKKLKRNEVLFAFRIIREPNLFVFSRSNYSVAIIFKFFSLIRTNDIILINSPSANILPFSIIAKLFRKKLIIAHHGDLILPGGFMNRLIEKIFDFSSFISFSLADKITTLTADYGHNSRVIRHHLSKFQPLLWPVLIDKDAKKNSNNEQMDLLRTLKKKKLLLFGFAGRFVEEKGFDILFDAIPQVIKKFPNAHFVFAGEINISYEHFFEKNVARFQKVKGSVTILGLLSQNDLDEFYKTITAIILPSRSDCFPLVQAEAMLHGTPSIASDIPGLGQMVKMTGFGLLFKRGDSSDLAKKIIQLVEEKKEILLQYKKVEAVLNNQKNAKAIIEYLAS